MILKELKQGVIAGWGTAVIESNIERIEKITKAVGRDPSLLKYDDEICLSVVVPIFQPPPYEEGNVNLVGSQVKIEPWGDSTMHIVRSDEIVVGSLKQMRHRSQVAVTGDFTLEPSPKLVPIGSEWLFPVKDKWGHAISVLFKSNENLGPEGERIVKNLIVGFVFDATWNRNLQQQNLEAAIIKEFKTLGDQAFTISIDWKVN
jgi:hypothetical protein